MVGYKDAEEEEPDDAGWIDVIKEWTG